MTHLEKLFAALYVSEQWYTLFEWERPFIKTPLARVPAHRTLYYKTKAVVIFDRELNEEN